MSDTKYIFVTGGVVSGLGKGISAASLGRLLKARGYKVTSQKLDPYINVDPGTMSPFQHGEVFVTDDGLEADLDLGHYERFIDENLHTYSNLTTGKVYWNVINKERDGKYLGETVQVIPHITDEIRSFIIQAGRHAQADVVITEIGGTTGDMESLPFLESIRQVPLIVGRNNCLFMHVTYIPYLSGSNEYKSKPTQHSVKELQSHGINPDMIVARCDEKIPNNVLDKISLFCNVEKDCVIENTTLNRFTKCRSCSRSRTLPTWYAASSDWKKESRIWTNGAGWSTISGPPKIMCVSRWSVNTCSCMTRICPFPKL